MNKLIPMSLICLTLLAPLTALSQPGGGEDALVQQELAALRLATAHYHRFENAQAAGWNLPVTDCVSNPPIGGMGYHFGHEAFYLDGEANLLEPEILLYEPLPNGRLKLVAVEYIVPLFAWQGEGTPQLFGRDMNWVEVFQEWQLHVWVWKHNPDGIFEDWNPAVSCEHAG